MARLEIPSIVVHNGSNSAPGSPTMERNLRAQRTLSKQAEFEELEEDESVPHKSNPSSSPGAAISMSCHCQGDDNTPSPASGNQTSDKQKTKDIRDDTQHQQQQRVCLSRANSVDTEDKSPPPLPRVRSHAKVKLLVRSHAMREETSPPPDPEAHHVPVLGPAPVQQQQQQPQTASTNSLSVGRPSSRHKLRHQGSSQGSMDSSSPCLSRDSSTEQYTDSTGVDLQQFIMDTLNRNQKDRILLLKIEQELVNLAKDNKRNHYKFPQMSSYQRMLVHRVAAYFGMDHNVDQTGNAVIVNRTKNTRLPDTKFRDHIREELLFPEEPRRSILKRDSSSFEDGCNFKSPERQFSSESRRSKSFEEREEEYEKARKRIFNREDGGSDPLHDSSRRSSQEDLRWPGEVQPWSSSDSDTSSRLRTNMLLHASDNSQLRPMRLPKGESFECRDMLKANSLRLSVSKSYSFGGYPVAVLSRGDSCTSTHSAGARLLTKQDSGSSMSSRLSPSSSGYKSQSQRSDTTTSATPSPTATPVSQLSISSSTQPQMSSHGALSPQHTLESSSREQNQTVMWAVTSMASVPPGSVLINPQTGQPYVNSDGTVYRYDPANPPKVITDEDSEAGSGGCGTNSHHKSAGSSEQMQPPVQQQTCQSQKSHAATTTSTLQSKTVCSTHVTTATSPSLPVSPPPVPLSSSPPHSNSTLVNTQATSQIPTAPQQPVLTICHSSQCSYMPNPAAAPTEPVQPQQHLGTLPVASIPICPQLANPNSTVVNAQTPAYSQQQFMPALQHQQPEVMFGNHMSAAAQSQQPAPPQMVFTGYNMVAVPPATTGTSAIAAATAGYEQRHTDGGSMAVSDLSSYFMGLGLMSSDQRGGGSSGGSGGGGGGCGGGGGVRGNGCDSSGSQQQAQPTAAGSVMPAPPTLHPHNYQSQPPAPAAYWQPQQQPNPIQHSQQQPPQQPTQQPLPMYFVPPALPAPPPPGPMLNMSPPQQANSSNSNPSTARYMAAYPPYQQVPTATQLCHSSAPSLPSAVPQETHQDRTQQSMGNNGGYVQNYPVMSYGAAVMTAPGNGECMPLYTQPSIHMLYTPTSINVNSLSSSSSSVTSSALPGGGTLSYYHPPSTPTAHTQPVMGLNMGPPYMQPSQHGAALGAYRAPTPPQTPTQSQALCSMPTHPYIYLNGGTYTPVYNGSGTSGNAPTPGPYSQQPTGTPSTPGPSQYIPPTIISNLGLFRSNMQMMSSVRSSPPPRPPRDGLGSKPTYCRSPSVGSKDRGNGSHYDVCGNDKSVTSVRYSSVPMFGLRIVPGDVRVMSQQPLSSSSPTLRMPFTLTSHPPSMPASHHPAHRMQHHPTHYPLGSQLSSSEMSIGSVGRPPKPRKQRSKVTATAPTNPVQNSLPPQASSTQPLSSAQVTLSTAVRGAGGQEAGRVLMMNDGSPSKQH